MIERKQYHFHSEPTGKLTAGMARDQVAYKLWDYSKDMHTVFGKKLLPVALTILDTVVMTITSMNPSAQVDFWIDKEVEHIYVVPSRERDEAPQWDGGYFDISIIFGRMDFNVGIPQGIEEKEAA